MLRSLNDLEHYTLDATDGEVGKLKDLYFDDDAWVIRYLVVDTGTWLTSRKVLVSPISVSETNWLDEKLSLSITRAQVVDSPNIDTDLPVSRQNEADYLSFYGYEPYWGGVGMWGAGLYPYGMSPGYTGLRVSRTQREQEQEVALYAERERHAKDDPHLRSCDEVNGYDIQALDGAIGHVSGYLVDDETWAIRYLIVDTSNWWMGHQVLVAPTWIKGVNWATQTVFVDLSLESLKAAPAYDPSVTWRLELDRALYEHHGRIGYWAGAGAKIAA